ncbi:MAG: FAD-dependent oxidoreductase, partial [Pseudomonadota bacterium]
VGQVGIGARTDDEFTFVGLRNVSVDVTPDRSPILAKTPVKGLYVNCGWGTGGFKATPGSAHVFAHTIANDAPQTINEGFTLERFRTGRLIDEAAAAAVAH